MPKRRRERDRPKAASSYDPNKRVLLCYDSDDGTLPGETEPKSDDAFADVLDAVPADYKIPVYEYSDEDRSVITNTAGSLPLSASIKACVGDMAKSSMAKPGESSRRNRSSLFTRGTRRNTATGQYNALGSASWQDEDGEWDPEEIDSNDDPAAVEYIRAVRQVAHSSQERQKMPIVLRKATTPTEEVYEDSIDDARGFFEDGAYISSTLRTNGHSEPVSTEIEPREAFATVLKQRFAQQRQRIRATGATQPGIDPKTQHPAVFRQNDSKAYAYWLRLLRTQAPRAAQLRAMDQESALRLIGLLEKRVLLRRTDVAAHVAAWVWSLLARLDDVGTLSSDQVYIVRELGKKAILVRLSFVDPDVAEELERTAAEETGGDSDAPEAAAPGDDVEPAPLAATQHPAADIPAPLHQNTLALLDTIIVLVGDVFGQRDLLDFQQPWPSGPDEDTNAVDAAAPEP